LRLYLRRHAKLGEDRIFDFQNGGCPPLLIWYDVIADQPRPVFDGPNILLKLHVDRVYILRDIVRPSVTPGIVSKRLNLS